MTSSRRRRWPTALVSVACTIIVIVAMGYGLHLRTAERDKSDAVALSYAQQVAVACADPAQRVQLVEVGVRCASVDEAVEALQQGDTPPPVVIPGAAGSPGPRGFTGPQGPRGVPGSPGTRGPRGVDGAPGPVGDTGPAGKDGATGPAGATGSSGSKGEKGDPGAAGPAGAAGDQGPKGDTGDQGPPGAPGADGAPGPAGPAGTALPGTYTCPDGQVLHGITVADDGTVTLDCVPDAVLLP